MSFDVECCRCMEWCLARETLMPNRCIYPGYTAHRICGDCWFGEKGFAAEAGDHSCPGCNANEPMTYVPGSECDDALADGTTADGTTADGTTADGTTADGTTADTAIEVE